MVCTAIINLRYYFIVFRINDKKGKKLPYLFKTRTLIKAHITPSKAMTPVPGDDSQIRLRKYCKPNFEEVFFLALFMIITAPQTSKLLVFVK